MGLKLQDPKFYDMGGGLDLISSSTKTAENASTLCLNVDYTIDGAVRTRFGSTIQNVTAGVPAQMSGAPRTLSIEHYRKSDGTSVKMVTAGGAIKHSLIAPSDVITGLSSTAIPDVEFQTTGDDEYAFWGNGTDDNLKFNGTIYTNWSLPRPTALSQNALAAGLLTGTYSYYVSFARTVGGVIVQESELSPVFEVTLASQQITLNVPVCSETLATGVTAQCNARVIYREDIASGVIYRITAEATIADNVTTTYTDNIPDADIVLIGIEASFDNQAAPNSAVFEENLGRMFIRNDARKTDVYYSKVGKPWNVPTENVLLFDGEVKCIKRLYGVLIFGTDRSLWVLDGDPLTSSPRRISSKIGILNNRCAVGEDILYILATNRQLYAISPTDFSQSEIRLDNPISTLIQSAFANISANHLNDVVMEYETKAEVSKIFISCAVGLTTNNSILVYNETQSIKQDKPVWTIWDNIKASAMRQMTIDNQIGVYTGDYNGFIWKIDDSSLYGDGSLENGTVTSTAGLTFTDSTQAWTVNEHVGKVWRFIDGTGIDQTGVVVSNTGTTVTVDAAFSITPDTTTQYTIGGYDAYHYTNWKSLTGSYENLKQSWYIWVNANASGSYSIQMLKQFDFLTSEASTYTTNITLSGNNTIWGAFIWGESPWGSQSVALDRKREYYRFRSVRIGFKNRKAGQPFQINTLGFSVQDKGLFYSSAA